MWLPRTTRPCRSRNRPLDTRASRNSSRGTTVRIARSPRPSCPPAGMSAETPRYACRFGRLASTSSVGAWTPCAASSATVETLGLVLLGSRQFQRRGAGRRQSPREGSETHRASRPPSSPCGVDSRAVTEGHSRRGAPRAHGATGPGPVVGWLVLLAAAASAPQAGSLRGDIHSRLEEFPGLSAQRLFDEVRAALLRFPEAFGVKCPHRVADFGVDVRAPGHRPAGVRGLGTRTASYSATNAANCHVWRTATATRCTSG